MPFFAKIQTLPIEPPDSIPIADYIFNDEYRDRSLETSKNPFTCGLSGKTYSNKEVMERIELIARSLSKEIGWKPNEGTEWEKVVGIFSVNSIDYLPLSWAIHRLSGIPSVASASYTTPELVHQLKTSGCKALFTCLPLLKTALEAASICDIPRKNVFILELSKEATGGKQLTLPPGFLTLDNLIDQGKKLPDLEKLKWSKGQGKRQTAYLCFSSGTSGLPKGVMCSHYNVIAHMIQSLAHFAPHLPTLSTPQTVLCLLPQSHIYSLVFICHLSILYGRRIIILPSFTLPTLLSTIQTHRINSIPLVPPIIISMTNNAPLLSTYNLSSVTEIMSAAAPLAPSTVQKFTAQHPTWKLSQAFGMTESCVGVSILLPDDDWPGSCGPLLPGYVAKLIDISGEEVTAYDTPGELVIRSPSIVLGYLKNEEANRETFRDGWLWTGDEAVFRRSGRGNEHLFIVDRIKELIKVKGSQVAPAELEAHILTHPLVADCAIIPTPDDYAGEVPKAFVVLKSSSEPQDKIEIAASIVKYVESAKARYKWIKGGVEFIEVIPKSPSGKILRRMLRDTEKVRIEGNNDKLRAKL